MNRLLFSFAFICAGTLYAPAQTAIFETLNRGQYLAKVKLVDEFFARFNGDEIRKYMGVEYSDR